MVKIESLEKLRINVVEIKFREINTNGEINRLSKLLKLLKK